MAQYTIFGESNLELDWFAKRIAGMLNMLHSKNDVNEQIENLAQVYRSSSPYYLTRGLPASAEADRAPTTIPGFFFIFFIYF
jgi:hypothetical protein